MGPVVRGLGRYRPHRAEATPPESEARTETLLHRHRPDRDKSRRRVVRDLRAFVRPLLPAAVREVRAAATGTVVQVGAAVHQALRGQVTIGRAPVLHQAVLHRTHREVRLLLRTHLGPRRRLRVREAAVVKTEAAVRHALVETDRQIWRI